MIIKNNSIPGSNGRHIIYDLYLQETPSPLLILVHGFKSYKDWGAYYLLAEYFQSRGISVCTFNFSHNGGTREQVIDFPDLEAFGRNTFSKEMDDLQSLLDYLLTNQNIKKGINPDNVFLIGHSRGGGISALTAIEDSRIRGMILLNAVLDLHRYMANIDTEHWRKNGLILSRNSRTQQDMPLYLDLLDDFESNKERFDIRARAHGFNKPTLAIHCADDAIVPIAESKKFVQLIQGAELLTLVNGGHTLGAKQPWRHSSLPDPLLSACEASLDFIERHVA